MSVRKQADCPCLDLPISLSASYDDHLIFASGLARVPVKFFVPEICFQFCRDRLYVCRSKLLTFRTLFLESFFELRFRLCFFILNGNFIFFLTRKTVFSKKTALSCIFFRISIDNLGPYMCYVVICRNQQVLYPAL